MVDSKMLQVLALTCLLLLVVVTMGLILDYGFPTNFAQLAILGTKPSPTPLVAVATTGRVLGARDPLIDRSFPPVAVSDATVSIFSPVLQPAVLDTSSNSFSVSDVSAKVGTAFKNVSDFGTVQNVPSTNVSSGKAYKSAQH